MTDLFYLLSIVAIGFCVLSFICWRYDERSVRNDLRAIEKRQDIFHRAIYFIAEDNQGKLLNRHKVGSYER